MWEGGCTYFDLEIVYWNNLGGQGVENPQALVLSSLNNKLFHWLGKLMALGLSSHPKWDNGICLPSPGTSTVLWYIIGA